MKSRSHRLPAYDPPEDWVNDSWIVDCYCGVNFDDGEEMVNCDECAVWVHTRCSRFVKGDKSFLCDKCKSKNSRNNESEETEVAQLLVELPTKTMHMSGNSNSNRGPMSYSGNPPPRKPYRLWTERPMEERVHVQGVPGGDPALFQDSSSIFTAELWKCSGYMPKKFNFQYREFPEWDGPEKGDENVADDSENMVDKGAGVLYSLSKDCSGKASDGARAGVQSQVDARSSGKKSSKGKRWEGLDANRKGMQSAGKERSIIRPIGIHSAKRKRDDPGVVKERTIKKKNKDHEIKKKKSPSMKTAFGPPTSGRNADSVAEKARNVYNVDVKHGQVQEVLLTGAVSVARAASCDSGKLRSSAATKESNLEADKKVNLEKNRNGSAEYITCSHKTDDTLSTLGLQDGDFSLPPIKEAMSLDKLELSVQTSSETDAVDSLKPKAWVDGIASAPIEDSNGPRKSENGVIRLVHAMRRKAVGDDGANSESVQKSPPCVDDVKMDGTEGLADIPVLSSNHVSENRKAIDTGVSSSNSADQKFDKDRGHEAASSCHMEKPDDVPAISSQAPQELLVPECSMEPMKFSSESKKVFKGAEETSKLDGTVLSPSASSSQRKLVSLGKSVSSSSNVAISRSSSSDKYKSSSPKQSDRDVIKRAVSNSIIYTKKDKAKAGLVKSEDKCELLRRNAKDRPKLSVNHAPKVSNPTKTPESSLKHSSGDTKDFLKHPSSKTPSLEKPSFPSTVGETSCSSKIQGTPDLQNKSIASAVQPKGEKSAKSNSLSSSKGSHSSLGHPAPSPAPAGLSDEELALLLHQELNSSLRVPRIPRVRQAGSLPHLSTSSLTNTLPKSSPSSATKDQHLFSRRKSKDAHKDGPRSSRDQENKGKKGDRVPSSPDSSKTADTLNLAETNSEPLDSGRKNAPASSNVASSSADSLRNISDDDAGTKGPLHRTLPGLIAEIMSKGKRMTYEELCNAVLPHWTNLRKHNGERYAYASPSQAVLDCLRNRAEWAQLVDRGPKTNASRKRRKPDTEGQNTESEDNGYADGGILKTGGSKSLEPSREEFPKGKRNARKRRRLALQGRNVKDVRKRRKGKVISDDESPSFSNSSEDSAYTEDESQEEGAAGDDAGSEDSASSDATGNTL